MPKGELVKAYHDATSFHRTRSELGGILLLREKERPTVCQARYPKE